MQVGTGSLGPLDALSGLALEFSPTSIGYLGSAHFLGFFVGCVLSPIIIARSGHARAFSTFAATATISILLHPILPEVWFWVILRMFTGFAVAGSYTVIESWLQAKVTRKNRGTVFSIYRMVDMSGTLFSQLIIAGLTPAHYISYNLIAAVACMALIPLALTQTKLPALPESQKFQPFFLYTLSPLAALGAIVVGATNSSFRMVAPVYAVKSGLDKEGVAIFLALAVIGGLVAQLPAGIIADKVSRRSTLIGFSIMASAVCGVMALGNTGEVAGIPFVYLGGFMFGFATLPIYSICVSHASDFAKQEEMLAMSASFIFFFAMGAVVAPSFAGYLISEYGPPAMFMFIMFAHFALLAYTLRRVFSRPAILETKPYNYTPRTSLYIAHWARRRRKQEDKGKTGV